MDNRSKSLVTINILVLDGVLFFHFLYSSCWDFCFSSFNIKSSFLLPSTSKNNLALFNTLSMYVSLCCNLRQGGQMLRRSEAPRPQTFFHASDPAVPELEDPMFAKPWLQHVWLDSSTTKHSSFGLLLGRRLGFVK